MNDNEIWPFPNASEPRQILERQIREKPWIPDPPAPMHLVNCRIVDPRKGALMAGLYSIDIVDGKFANIAPNQKAEEQQNAKSSAYDMNGYYLCPGLFDAHTHVAFGPGAKTFADVVRVPFQVVTLRSAYVLREMLARGFTTIRDTGGATKHIATSIEEGLISGPRLFQCGKALSPTGGHGDFVAGESGGDGIGCCSGVITLTSRTADGVPMCLKAAREELKQGGDFIKIMAGGGVASETDPIESLQYTAEEIRAITTTAKNMGGKMVTAHAYTPASIKHAVENGVTGIEHGNLLDQETAKLMAMNKVYLTPTLSCHGIMERKPFENFLTPAGKAKNKQVIKQGLAALKIAEENGVTVCYGSDLLLSMHAFQTEEFMVRSQVLPASSILRHATINPAEMVGMKGKLGEILPGAFADFIVLRSNPLDDITSLDRPEENLVATVKAGRLMFGALAQ